MPAGVKEVSVASDGCPARQSVVQADLLILAMAALAGVMVWTFGLFAQYGFMASAMARSARWVQVGAKLDVPARVASP